MLQRQFLASWVASSGLQRNGKHVYLVARSLPGKFGNKFCLEQRILNTTSAAGPCAGSKKFRRPLLHQQLCPIHSARSIVISHVQRAHNTRMELR